MGFYGCISVDKFTRIKSLMDGFVCNLDTIIRANDVLIKNWGSYWKIDVMRY
jgi:hypothetical protein